jgi:hypothetical protein
MTDSEVLTNEDMDAILLSHVPVETPLSEYTKCNLKNCIADVVTGSLRRETQENRKFSAIVTLVDFLRFGFYTDDGERWLRYQLTENVDFRVSFTISMETFLRN